MIKEEDSTVGRPLTAYELKRRERIRWMLSAHVAIFTAALGAIVESSIHWLSNLRVGVVEKVSRRNAVVALWLNLFLCLGMCTVACCCVLVAPRAKGSGIPEIKAILNGASLQGVLTRKTLSFKLIGIIFAVAGGLPCGKEGPMVHFGAVCGALRIAFEPRTSCSIDYMKHKDEKKKKMFRFLRCGREARDFVATGTACGVASAFGSVIGGVCFMIEEAASSWNQRLFFRSTFAATINVCTVVALLTFLRPTVAFGDKVRFGSMATFDSFDDDYLEGDENQGFSFAILLIGALLGAALGAWGAFFNYMNARLTKLRASVLDSLRHRHTLKTQAFIIPLAKLTEVLLVSALCAILSFGPAVLPSRRWCRRLDAPNPFGVAKSYSIRFQCNDHEYNELASITMTPLPTQVASIFHARSVDTFSIPALCLHFFLTSILACLVYGTHVPSGLFMPSICIGASAGRLAGLIILPAILVGETRKNIARKLRSLAFCGGIAGLAGTTRMTVSIVAIFMSTILGDEDVVPLFVAALASKLVGDVFNEGLYDIHIHFNRYPFLDDHPPPPHEKAQDLGSTDNTTFLVRNRMTQNVACLPVLVQYQEVIRLLRSTTHHGFPVIDNDRHFIGLITRSELCILLLNAQPPQGFDTHVVLAPAVKKLSKFRNACFDLYPRFPRVDDLQPVSVIGPESTVDLDAVASRSALTIQPDANFNLAWALFRSLGLRHLVVIENTDGRVCGILTRSDLIHLSSSSAHENETKDDNRGQDKAALNIEDENPRTRRSMFGRKSDEERTSTSANDSNNHKKQGNAGQQQQQQQRRSTMELVEQQAHYV